MAVQCRWKRGGRPLIASFGLLLWLPLLAMLHQPEHDLRRIERRSLAPLPELSWAWPAAAGLPKQFEAYFDDHLGLRAEMIAFNALLRISLFGVSPSRQVVVGKQGWFFFGDDDAVAQYRGVVSLSASELARWQRVLEERRDFLARRGTPYLLVLVPNKHRMYAEFMPASLPRHRETSHLDQLVEHLEANSDVELLDLRDVLGEEKRLRPVYHRTDSHWNDFGAYAASAAILERVKMLRPDLKHAPLVAVDARRRTLPGRELVQMIGLESLFSETVVELSPRSPRSQVAPEHRASFAKRVEQTRPFAMGVPDSGLPRAVLFRDSFSNQLIPYLSESFERILYVWTPEVLPGIVAREDPDVVIHEISERFLVREPHGIREILKDLRHRKSAVD